MSDCVFCAIASDDAPAHCLYEDEQTLAFLDIEAATRGHTLIVPKAHYQTVTDMKRSLTGAVFETAHRIAAALESAFELDGYNVVSSNGAAAGQEVDHAHVHVVPRYEGDGVELGWSGEAVDETRQQEIASEIRETVDSTS